MGTKEKKQTQCTMQEMSLYIWSFLPRERVHVICIKRAIKMSTLSPYSHYVVLNVVHCVVLYVVHCVVLSGPVTEDNYFEWEAIIA